MEVKDWIGKKRTRYHKRAGAAFFSMQFKQWGMQGGVDKTRAELWPRCEGRAVRKRSRSATRQIQRDGHVSTPRWCAGSASSGVQSAAWEEWPVITVHPRSPRWWWSFPRRSIISPLPRPSTRGYISSPSHTAHGGSLTQSSTYQSHIALFM